VQTRASPAQPSRAFVQNLLDHFSVPNLIEDDDLVVPELRAIVVCGSHSYLPSASA
jgi:hypothetical protein